MKVHHLNLCTMCPYGGGLVTGDGAPLWTTVELVIHALLVETDRDGLVLVDTGLGLGDVRRPKERLGGGFLLSARPRLDEAHTAIRQVERLGFAAKDVRHIVTTHLDLDHAGGLSDFPDAEVHVHRAERDAAIARASMLERERYREAHFAHGPKWRLHELASAPASRGHESRRLEPDGETWNGFASLRAVSEDILLVPLAGHTRGHSGVAVRTETGWLLHCGDAYFFHAEVDDPPHCSWGLSFYQRAIAIDDRARLANQARLRELKKGDPSVTLFCAHSPVDYARLTGSGA